MFCLIIIQAWPQTCFYTREVNDFCALCMVRFYWRNAPNMCTMNYIKWTKFNELCHMNLIMNSMKLVIPLHWLYWSIHTKDESKRGTAFAFSFGVNWLWRCGVTASFGVFFHEVKCNRMTSFMEFMQGKRSHPSTSPTLMYCGFIITNHPWIADKQRAKHCGVKRLITYGRLPKFCILDYWYRPGTLGWYSIILHRAGTLGWAELATLGWGMNSMKLHFIKKESKWCCDTTTPQ